MKFGAALVLVCVHAFAGGLVGSWYFTPPEDRNPTFESVVITKNLLVAENANSDQGCRLRADGTLTVSEGVLANQMRAQVISAQSLLASRNPLTASFDDQEILAQMSADPRSGGKIIALSRDAALVPSTGAPQGGKAACIRFHPESGAAEIFTHDLARGELGKSFMVAIQRQAAKVPDSKNATVQR